jgi:hypothetical protein
MSQTSDVGIFLTIVIDDDDDDDINLRPRDLPKGIGTC